MQLAVLEVHLSIFTLLVDRTARAQEALIKRALISSSQNDVGLPARYTGGHGHRSSRLRGYVV